MKGRHRVAKAHEFEEPPRSAGGVALCRSCLEAGLCRLGFETERLDGVDSAVYELRCPKRDEGGLGRAHGGWTASAFDEGLGHLPGLLRHDVVTATLTVDFLKPVPITEPLRLSARLDFREGRRWHISGELRLVETGTMLARGKGIWIDVADMPLLRPSGRQTESDPSPT
jgi:acyl-coenzyme A thioesterase PaaI-like protein